MSKNKNASDRYRILDECFKNGYHMSSGSLNPEHKGYWSRDELLDKIYEKLGLTISERLLAKDIADMKLEYSAPIRNCRGVGWKYANPEFSIFDNPLNEKDYKLLGEVADILKNYRGFKYFEDADTIISKIEENINRSDFFRIQLDTLPDYSGINWIAPLKDAIFSKKVVQLTNKEFNGSKDEVIFHPYILKEYNNRWFVLGFANKKNNKFGEVWLFALDRILKIKSIDKKYKKPDKKEIKNYFSNIYGVTNYKNRDVEKVILKLDKFRSNYFKTKPIHVSQKLIKEETDYDYYSLKLKLNNEIISLFLSFGKDLEVIEPKSFREEMNNHITRMFNLYNSEFINSGNIQ